MGRIEIPSGKLYSFHQPSYHFAVNVTGVFQVFTKLLEERDQSVFQNIVVVAGDVGEDGLGLSEADKANVIENVNIVFHCAATLDFDTDLPTNVNINLLGTKRILELCAQLKSCRVSAIMI